MGKCEQALCLTEEGAALCVSLLDLDLYFWGSIRLVLEVLICIAEFNALVPPPFFIELCRVEASICVRLCLCGSNLHGQYFPLHHERYLYSVPSVV